MSKKPATFLAKAGHFTDPQTGGVVPPLYSSTTYVRDEDYELPHGRQYGRDNNPLYEQVEQILCQLEGGADGAVFSSGLAAMAAVVSVLQAGERLLVASEGYYGCRGWMQREAARIGFELVLFRAYEDGALEQALDGSGARMVWIETPANPTWSVVDIEKTAKIAHAAGAALVVDATVMTPLICQPIALGADIIMHSATKYLNGHSDAIAGVLVSAKDDQLWSDIKETRRQAGPILGPFEAWLLIRGMRTLHLRVRESSRNAMAIARHFEKHPAVEAVLYPGLESHPAHAIALKQYDTKIGFSGMMSFLLKGGFEVAKRFTLATKEFAPATSLGGVESLIEHRFPVEGPDSPTPHNLVRLSVGIEDVGELIADIEQALAKATS
jgi:cystathionine gamma-synthase